MSLGIKFSSLTPNRRITFQLDACFWHLQVLCTIRIFPHWILQLSESLNKAYCISEASEADTIDLIEALTKIRSLLCVKLGNEEEGMIIKGLK